MPSPVGHSLIGLAIAVQYGIQPGRLSAISQDLRKKAAILFAGVLLANLPDVDYIPGICCGEINAFHHYYTHSIGWVLTVTLACWLGWKFMRPAIGVREIIFVFAALVSHLAADAVTADGHPPYGFMAFWPWSDRFVISPVTIFWRLHKHDWSEVLQWHNVWAVVVEVAICLPFLVLAVVLKWRPGQKEQAPRLRGAPVSGD